MYSNNSFNGKCMSIVDPKLTRPPVDPDYWAPDYRKTTLFIIFALCDTYIASTSPHLVQIMPYTRVGTLIVATIYLQLIQNRYMFRSFTVLQCSHQHCVQPFASDVEVTRA